uniref:NAD(+) ADP-ribosyltransferase n=1 Tax=Strongyloides venezuelensis TaxID=75913 RepID=A0A0K0F5V3_STRVS
MITNNNTLTITEVKTRTPDLIMPMENDRLTKKGKRSIELDNDLNLNQKRTKTMDMNIVNGNEEMSFFSEHSPVFPFSEINRNISYEETLDQGCNDEDSIKHEFKIDVTTFYANTNNEEENVGVLINSYNTIECGNGWNVLSDNYTGPYNVIIEEPNNNSANSIDILQILKKDEVEQYTLLQRLEREGHQPQSIYYSGTKEALIDIFCCKFKEKTGQVYSEYKKKFSCQVFNEIERDNNILISQPYVTIREILKMIFDIKNITQCLEEMSFNLETVSLSDLSKIPIKNAYQCLERIILAVKEENVLVLTEEINKYYRYIPHKFDKITYRFLQTMEDWEKENELLDKLTQIQEIMEITKKHEISWRNDNDYIFDIFYKEMNWELNVIPSKSEIRNTIEYLIQKTEGFENEIYKCVIRNIFEIKRKTEIDESLDDNISPNTQILWYGSRVKNWYNILSQGCRIIPNDICATVEMFQNIVYIADVSENSTITSCYSSPGQSGFFGLVEAVVQCPFINLHSNTGIFDNSGNSENCFEDEFYQTKELYFGGNKYTVCKPNQIRLRYIVELMFI